LGYARAVVTTAPLEVALDASLWDEPTTGIGLYTRQLAAALERLGVRTRCYGARISGDVPRHRIGRTAFTLGKLPAILARASEPLYHAVCNFNLPLARVPGKRFVLTVHDLIPEVLPDTVSIPYRWQFRLWLWRSLSIADRVICDSERSRQDLIERFDAPPEKVRAIHLGVDHVDAVGPPDAAGIAYLDALGLPRDFVLYAGALDARKNIGLLLDACARLQRAGKPVTLVLAGQRWFGSGPVERRIAELRAEGLDLRPLGYQTSEIFYELMRRAAVFVFPSRYEGFGLPPLEAMHLGVPAIISDAGSLPEVCGGAAVQVGVDDAEALASAISRLLADPAQRRALGELGKAHARAFTWERTARQTIEVYREALR